jgi:hypothetical protein
MTEADWLTATDPEAMLGFLRDSGRATDRQLRLFAVACCRRIWPLLTDERSRNAVEVAERYADGLRTFDSLEEATTAAIEATWAVRDERDRRWPEELPWGTFPAAMAAEMASASEGDGLVWGASGGFGSWEAALDAAAHGADVAVRDQEGMYQGALLRDIFGPPAFRPLSIAPSVLSWNDGTVRRLAETAYEERELPAGTLEPARLAVLADALEEAGCTDAEVLGHLRGHGPHVRGCWALDFLLGRS